MAKYDTIVIGGGAAGLLAAGQSAKLGDKVLLLEKMSAPGRKLSITGKGRCNLTNTSPIDGFIENIYPDGRFLKSAFSVFFSQELIDFFNELNIHTTTERGGRVFPESGKAEQVVKALVNFCHENHVEIQCNCQVTRIITDNKHVSGVEFNKLISNSSTTENAYADKVIIATGGASYPATGSTGDGYKFAKALGHTVTRIFPTLVPLETDHCCMKEVAGLELKNISCKIRSNDNKAFEAFGELSFTETGISGPVVLSLSRAIVEALMDGKEIQCSIDLKPALDNKKLDDRLLRDINSHGKETLNYLLAGLLPKKLIPACIHDLSLSPSKLNHQITAEERSQLRSWLKDFHFSITGYRPLKEAIATAGGVDLKEINQKTMSSKIVKGLYFVGEVLDLDGATGGYNLQIAFSTAWVAAHQ